MAQTTAHPISSKINQYIETLVWIVANLSTKNNIIMDFTAITVHVPSSGPPEHHIDRRRLGIMTGNLRVPKKSVSVPGEIWKGHLKGNSFYLGYTTHMITASHGNTLRITGPLWGSPVDSRNKLPTVRRVNAS